MNATTDILAQILARKREEISQRRQLTPINSLQATARATSLPRGFASALRQQVASGQVAVIAEIKKASPSQGVIRPDFVPREIARSYSDHGATCLSVLTDETFFQGHAEHLREARDEVALPVLRKDFIIDPWQVVETRAIGGDCVLLIVAALDFSQMSELASATRDLGMDVLVEVHDRSELEGALKLNSELIGINNRSLQTFDTRLETTLDLIKEIPVDRLIVTESGIHQVDDVQRMRDSGVNAFLVGETFMRAADPGSKLSQLFSGEVTPE